MAELTDDLWDLVDQLVQEVQAAGDAIGLPFVAAQADLGDPEPMADRSGRPFAETTFRWVNPGHQYWRNRQLALQAPLLGAARLLGEPFYYSRGQLLSWRRTALLDAIDCRAVIGQSSEGEAIIAPVHLPRGVIGAIVWCAREPVGVAQIFADHAPRLHAMATRLVAAHNEARGRPRHVKIAKSLTRREVQCLRWASVGKTDSEISIILGLSVSTVRFHLRNAAAKLEASGRAHAIQLAAGLGYVGARTG